MKIVVRSMIDELKRQRAKLPDQVLYDLEWRFTRCDEDLGMIEAPSPAAVISPSP